MEKYFIYCRKSSEDEERQILSIEAQLSFLATEVKPLDFTSRAELLFYSIKK